MQFIVHGHHLELTDSLKERCRAHVLERAEKLVDDTAARLEIELSDHFGQKRGKADKSCRIDLRVPGLPPIHVTEMRSSMHEAIDLAADRLVEALRRGVEKKEDRRRSGDIRNQALIDDASPAEETDEV
jgi:ribosomal subunit interface protein